MRYETQGPSTREPLGLPMWRPGIQGPLAVEPADAPSAFSVLAQQDLLRFEVGASRG
ncbi:hypothetical protein M877_01510 [Streptomyces niveus NCIMB 11891]|nr:hypothetical protein M877_01510 [Streptomyces niveus NCIMB 11891]